MNTRKFGGMLLLSLILLTTYHLCKRGREELVIANSVLSTSQEPQTARSLHSRDRLPSANHKLLQYNDHTNLDPHLTNGDTVYNSEQYSEQEVVLNDGYRGQEREMVETEDSSNNAPMELSTDIQGARVATSETIGGESISSSDTSHLLRTYNTARVHNQQSNGPRALTEVRHATQDYCDVSSIKSWRKGVVTELKPRIGANCDRLRRDDRAEIKRVKKEISSWQSSESEEEWVEGLSDCEQVVNDFSNNFYNSPEELEFPIAYILVIYTNPQQMVRLIKALWRPQNLFCIHPDAKQSEEFIGIFRQLSKCLDNVFLPTKLEKVYYQHHTIMDSQLNCYGDLLTFPPDRWKYVINLCGRELPLKTNREIVKSLKTLKGGSAIESKHLQSKGALARDRFLLKAAENYTSGKLHYTHERLDPPPIPVYKSFNFIAVSRPFVNFIVNDKKAIEFRNYLKDVKIPEEEFYASLIHLHGVPGGLPPHHIQIPTIDKYIWMNKYTRTRSKQESCEGKMVHFICIVGVGDLDQIYRWGVNRARPVFFFNKYFMEFDHVVMDCMEERLLNRNMKEHEADCKHKQLQIL